MPTLSTWITLLRSTLIGLPSGMRARTAVEKRVQDSIITLPAQCTRVIAGCFSVSSCNTRVAFVAIASLPLNHFTPGFRRLAGGALGAAPPFLCCGDVSQRGANSVRRSTTAGDRRSDAHVFCLRVMTNTRSVNTFGYLGHYTSCSDAYSTRPTPSRWHV